ncbi:MAG TPA: sialidase family protein [Thermoanaerobaculia bacterium]|nr:sialidase family protein [Thermoanaerobaculia bacterium]
MLPLLVLLSTLAEAQPRLLAGPDVLVSSENDFPHVEMMIAAHPTDPRQLTAGSMALVGSQLGTMVYSSADGGTTWSPGYPVERISTDADPVVVYTPRGTALYLALPSELTVDAAGKRHAPIILYRSEDNGRLWQKPLRLGPEGAYDHPQITVDPRSGRVYVSAVVGQDSRLELFRSDDDGRTFAAPKVMTKAPSEEVGLNTTGLAVLSDGTLVHTYIGFDMGQMEATIREQMNYAMVSRDGGETFSEPVLAGKQVFLPYANKEYFSNLHTFPQMAAGADRIYMAWTDFRSGRPLAMLTWSADRGKTWSETRPVAGALPEGAYSFQPSLAVNKDGVLGVSWLDTRNHPGTDRYDAYFSASLDGGATFLPPVRLSSESSDPLGAGNQRPSPGTFQDRNKTIRVGFISALTRYPHGGDYVGLAADAEGHFHPLWPDSRTGTFQAWTTRVKLERGGPANPALAAAGAPMDLKDHIELTFDPATYDGESRELRLPIRIRNRSEKTIRGPLQVRVKTFGSGMGDMYKENTPTILNAPNGEKGVGAVFDYSQAFGDFGALEPGATTEPVLWRFKLVGAEARTPDMHLEVTGRLAP